jgi:hypothetical protein
MSWIQSLEGHTIYLDRPDAKCISLETIAVVLSRTCRFKGHCREFYSNAQHSVTVMHLGMRYVEGVAKNLDMQKALLLHDAHEVYDGFGDIASPAKSLNLETHNFLRHHADKWNRCIAYKFGLPDDIFDHPTVKYADRLALAIEQRELMNPNLHPDAQWSGLPDIPADCRATIRGWDMDSARREFMAACGRLGL